MKTPFIKIFFIITFCWLVAGCDSGSSQNQSRSPKALPASWSDPLITDDSSLELPSPAATQSVENAFLAHSQALENLSPNLEPFNLATAKSRPLDWVPWHLDGFQGIFAVDLGGVFGILGFDGTHSLKVTWQKSPLPQPQNISRNHKSGQLKFNASMNQEDVSKSLEPVIRSVLATGSIKDESQFRQNMNDAALDFYNNGLVVDRIPELPQWRVAGYQLQLTFNAQGQLTPTMGVGGSVQIIFDWQKTSAAQSGLPSVKNPLFFQNLQSLVRSLSSVVAEAVSESQDLQKYGFVLSQFQVGFAPTLGFKVGIVQAGVALAGKIIFEKAESGAETSVLDSPAIPDEDMILIVPAQKTPGVLTRISGFFKKKPARNDQAVKIPRSRFKNGVKRAIAMASFFVTHLKSTDTKTWKAVALEAEYDTNVTGDLKLVTLGGVGTIEFDFSRAGL